MQINGRADELHPYPGKKRCTMQIRLNDPERNALRSVCLLVSFFHTVPAKPGDATPAQSPAMLIRAIPVIFPSALKPSKRLAASPRGNVSFTS
jgi:hypothetical protein